MLRIDETIQVMPKGLKEPVTIYDVGGIAGDYQLFLPAKREVEWVAPTPQLLIQFSVLKGKHVGDLRHKASIIKLAPQMAEIMAEILPPTLSNLRLSLYDCHDQMITDNLYAKVLKHLSHRPPLFQVNFTAIPPEAESFFQNQFATFLENKPS